MKQLTKFWSLRKGYCLIALFLFASCSVMDDCPKEQAGDAKLSLNVTPDGWNDELSSEATRASYSALTEGSSGNKTFNMSFTSGDAIGLFICDKDGEVVVANHKWTYSGSAWTTETPIEYITGMGSSYTYFAYYPWVSSLSGAPALNSTPDITSAEAFFASAISAWTPAADQSSTAGFTGSDLMVGKGTTTMPYFHEVSVAFTMSHQMGLAVTKDELSYYDINDPTDTWSEPQTFSGNIPYAVGTERYFIVKPGVETTLGTKSTTLEARQVEQLYFTNGEPVSVPVTDLSMVDNAGNERASMTTANCYLVHEKGKYKLPLVYGNSIKNGIANTEAYNPGGETSSTYCANFVNHNDDPITGPWITKNGSGVDAGMGLTAASAELLWQEYKGSISAVYVDGNYLHFKVGTFHPSNAVIAVKDDSGTILWSWHIWETKEDLSNTTIVSTRAHDYTVAPINLGWVAQEVGGKNGHSLYYQWGRKDPFNQSNATFQESTTATIADNIKNPKYFYYNNITKGPVNTTYYNMWDAQNTVADNVISSTKKTIYDPCPPGFCVPTGNLWYYIGNGGTRSNSNWDSTNFGKYWSSNGDDLFFRAEGYLQAWTGNIYSKNYYGEYWSATHSDTSNSRFLRFYSNAWMWLSNYRSNGYSVRPVAEE